VIHPRRKVEWIDKHRKKGGKDSENASVGDFAEAASFGDDLIVLCTGTVLLIP
jgi:hypothetical protein